MNLEQLVAVSGMQGIYKVVGNRSNGLIIEDLENGKRRFAPSRNHQFSPLESISIYTYDDSVPLKDVFQSMKDQYETLPPVDHNASNQELNEYFRNILEEYDEDRVKISDIKKVIKWFGFLKNLGFIDAEETSTVEEAAAEEPKVQTEESGEEE